MEQHPLIQSQIKNCFSNPEKLSGELAVFIQQVSDTYKKFDSERKLLRTIIDNLPDDIYVKDIYSRKILTNPIDVKNSGCATESEVLGKDDFSFYPKEIAERFYADDQSVIKTGSPIFNREEYFIDAEGQKRWLLTSKLPLRNNEGEIIGLIGIGHDITNRKKLEEQLRQSKKMESISTLAGGIAHDFNNILGIILAYVTYMQSDSYDKTKAEENMLAVTNAIKRGSTLVSQLLTFAKRTEKKLEPIDIEPFLNQFISTLKGTFPISIECISHIAPNLPPVIADQSQLYQVLYNLSVNARDAMPSGGRISFTVEELSGAALRNHFPAAVGEHYIQIQISDTGTGMDEKTVSRIFEPFFTTKPKDKGTGLGLSVVYGIIQSHDGYIDVESKIGNGTTFTLYLPAKKQSATAAQSKNKELQQLKGGTETVLFVEDETLLLSFVRSLLEAAGYHVLSAENGKDALEIFIQNKHTIELVLADIGLPKINGVELAEKIREEKPSMPIIFVTGNVEQRMLARIAQLPHAALLRKPYEPREILLKIRETLDTNVKK